METIDKLIFWANNNQGFLAVLLFVLGGLGALIFKNKTPKKFIQKGGKNSKNYQAENLTMNNHE